MSDRNDVLRQVLEIVDMFEDENMRMAADAVILNLNQRRASGPADLIEHFAVETDTHAAMMHCARLIGDTIRQKFGIPTKEG